jgi:hypothetical protein
MDFSFIDKVQVVTGCCPNPFKRRFIKKGAPLLEKEFDLLDLILEHRLSHHYVSGLGHELDFQKKINVE